MAISETYAELITEQIIQEILQEGESPSVSEITDRFEAFTDANDLSLPLLDMDESEVARGEVSSATKYNTTNNNIQRDLKVAYRHLFKLSDQSVSNFQRWRNEAKLIEGRLDILSDRINSLLLLSSDTAGYFNFVQDNFSDIAQVDLDNSTAHVNLNKGVVHIGTSSTGATRIDLSGLVNKDVEFTVLSKTNLVSTAPAAGSQLSYVISDITNFWQDRVYTNKPGPVSVELKVDLQEVQELSRIDMDLHMANQNSTVQVTPMYSTDNYSWAQLPIAAYTRSIVDKSTFQFAAVQARYVKFIMTKVGFDQVHKGLYSYEFGMDEISFYNEGFPTSTTGSILMSKLLAVYDPDGQPEQFSRIAIEVCEDIPDGTAINYFVQVTDDSTASPGNFAPIDPLDRVSPTQPVVLDFGDLDLVEVTGVGISYAPGASANKNINPDEEYSFIESATLGVPSIQDAEQSSPRYAFLNNEDRILDHCIGSEIDIAEGTLEVWRNVNTQGSNTKIRGYVNGWGFSDPYYKTTVYVESSTGVTMDFGGEAVILDGVPSTGKVSMSEGRHIIEVHKDNWKDVDQSAVSDLATLKVEDPLYPYNHRYLVEGFNYPGGYPSDEEQLYRGFEIVAEYFMKEVSVFDMINNVPRDGYDTFSLDLDVGDEERQFGGNSADNIDPATVFLLKVDSGNPDFVNEQFMLRFKSANTLFRYLRFKAVLTTDDTSITPFLDSYRVKISS